MKPIMPGGQILGFKQVSSAHNLLQSQEQEEEAKSPKKFSSRGS